MKDNAMSTTKKNLLSVIFSLICIAYVMPILVVVFNSFKKKTFINLTPFELPNADTWVGLDNYISGIEQIKFFRYFGHSLFITVSSVLLILICCSMCAWYISRVNNRISKILFNLFVFSMVVPFQMVMFTLSKTADMLRLNTPYNICIIYLGFGAGLAVFMFCGFIKSIPLDIEEAAMIDGCNPLQTYFRIVLPILKPTYISVGILETMWIWNDYLLPWLVLDITKYRTIPIVIQYLRGGYGRVDMGALMACMTMAMIPVIVVYLLCQKHIIEGVVSGAVKG